MESGSRSLSINLPTHGNYLNKVDFKDKKANGVRCFRIFARHTSVKADIVAPISGLVEIHIISNPNAFPRSLDSFEQDGQKVNDSLKACLINFDFEKFIKNYATTKSMFSTTSNVEVENQRCLSKFFVI